MSDSEDNASINSEEEGSIADEELPTPSFPIKSKKITEIEDDEELEDEEDEDSIYDENDLEIADIVPEKTTPQFAISSIPGESNLDNLNVDDVPLSEDEIYEDDSEGAEDEDDEYEEDEDYNKKFARDINENYVEIYHPETISHNFDEVTALSSVIRNKDNMIIDDLHKTIPFLSKFEKTKILGLRACQLSEGSKPFINVNKEIISSYIIATMELKQKKIPFIIRRPLPNGSSEYWKIQDLEIII